jgi:iron complex transport system substrate-binding protein
MPKFTTSLLSRCILIAALPLLLLVYFAFVKENPENPNWLSPLAPERVISFVPSATEILYELGLGDRVVGVTQFCNYPPDAARKEKVGSHTDPNYEAILRLKPDLMVILKEERELTPFLDKYGIRYVTIGSDSVEEIIESVRLVAAACGVGEGRDSLAQILRNKLDTQLVATNNNDKPKVLLCVSRDNVGSGAVNKCFVAGASSFYNQLIESAGGVNALKDVSQAYPSISAESVVRLDPDIIIDISSSHIISNQQEATCGDWDIFKSVAAVKTKNVRCLSGDYLTIPGPRFVLILDDLKIIFSQYAETRS